MNTKARTLETLAEVGLGPGVMVCDEMCAFVRPHGDPTTAVCMFVMFFVPKEEGTFINLNGRFGDGTCQVRGQRDL